MGYENKKSYNQYNKDYGERKNYTNKNKQSYDKNKSYDKDRKSFERTEKAVLQPVEEPKPEKKSWWKKLIG